MVNANYSQKFSSISTSDNSSYSLSPPDMEELTIEEERIYCILFDVSPGEGGVKVNETMKKCLSKLSSMGLHEEPNYPKFVHIGKKAIDNDFDSVEKNGLHVINGSGDAELICRRKTEEGEWKFVAVIEKSLIEELYGSRGLQATWGGIDLSNNNTSLNTRSIFKK